MIHIAVRNPKDGEALSNSCLGIGLQAEHLEKEIADKLVKLNPDALSVMVELRATVWNPLYSSQRATLPLSEQSRMSAYSHQLTRDLLMLKRWEEATTDIALRNEIALRRAELQELLG